MQLFNLIDPHLTGDDWDFLFIILEEGLIKNWSKRKNILWVPDFDGVNYQKINFDIVFTLLKKKPSLKIFGVTVGDDNKLSVINSFFQSQLLINIPLKYLNLIHIKNRGLSEIEGDILEKKPQEVVSYIVRKNLGVQFKKSTLRSIKNQLTLRDDLEIKELQKEIMDLLVPDFILCNGIWYFFNTPGWETVSEDAVKEKIREVFLSFSGLTYISGNLFNSFFKDLAANTTKFINFSQNNYVCFQNGVLNQENHKFIKTQEFKSYFFSDYLKYDYQELDVSEIETSENFIQTLKIYTPNLYQRFKETLGDERAVEIVCLFASAVLKRIPLDRFLFLVGPPNTGKSTTMSFFDQLFIPEVVITKTLSEFSNQFGLAELAHGGIRLLMVRDGESTLSAHSATILKSIVSNGELISVQRKFMTTVPVSFYGGLIIASNFSDIFQKHGRGIVDKRLIPLEFNKTIPPQSQIPMGQLFTAEDISFFISICLKVEKNFILKSLRQAHKIPSIGETRERIFSSSTLSKVELFVDEKIQRVEGGFIHLGSKPIHWKIPGFKTLYGEYKNFFEENYPKETVEHCTKFQYKFESVIHQKGWKTDGKPLVKGGIQKRIPIPTPEGDRPPLRGYTNVDWKPEQEEEIISKKYSNIKL